MVDRLGRALDDLRRKLDELAAVVGEALRPTTEPVPVRVPVRGGRQTRPD